MKQKTNFLILSLILAGLVMFTAQAFAEQPFFKNGYAVTVTNLTRGQVFSPPVVISHKSTFTLFTPGYAASPELYPLAEDAMNQPLIDFAASSLDVMDYGVGTGPIPPGHSATIHVESRGAFRYISLASMLVTTNDAFVGVRGHMASPGQSDEFYALAYDAGSEANSETCATIPGPPCGNGGVRDTAMAEGFVHVHAGIQGIADLMPSEFDWRNPVAKIEIRPTQGF